MTIGPAQRPADPLWSVPAAGGVNIGQATRRPRHSHTVLPAANTTVAAATLTHTPTTARPWPLLTKSLTPPQRCHAVALPRPWSRLGCGRRRWCWWWWRRHVWRRWAPRASLSKASAVSTSRWVLDARVPASTTPPCTTSWTS